MRTPEQQAQMERELAEDQRQNELFIKWKKENEVELKKQFEASNEAFYWDFCEAKYPNWPKIGTKRGGF